MNEKLKTESFFNRTRCRHEFFPHKVCNFKLIIIHLFISFVIINRGGDMKLFIKIFFVILITYFSGCGDSSTGPGGGLTGGNITFGIQGQGDPNSYTFSFQPSVNAKLTGIIASLPAQNFFDTLVNNNVDYVFSKDTVYSLDPYIGVQQGQVWNFNFIGKYASNNSDFNVNSGFTVP